MSDTERECLNEMCNAMNPAVSEGDVVAVSVPGSPNQLNVGTVVRVGTELRIGDLVLHDDEIGARPGVKIRAVRRPHAP